MVRNLKDSVIQTVKFTRTADKDQVTGKITYNDWTPASGKWDAYTAPVIDGYQATPTVIPEQDVTADTKSTSVNIMYTALGGTITINFVDNDNNNSVIDTQTYNGVVGAKPQIDLQLTEDHLKEQGYVINNSNIPTEIAFTNQAQSYKVNLKHNIISNITPDNSQGVKDLLRNVTRTINIVTNN
nr:MAG TPA: Mucin binding domain [Caudoviricetes sp.]